MEARSGLRTVLLWGLLTVLLTGGLALLVGRLDGVVAVPVALACAGLVAMLLRPDLPLCLTVVLLYTNVAVVLSQRGLVPGAAAAGVIGLLAIPLAYHLVLERGEVRFGIVGSLMVVLLGTFVLSAALAFDVAVSFERIAGYVLEGLVLHLLIVNTVRTVPTIRRVVVALLLAGGILGGLTLIQGVTGAHDNAYGGLAQSSFAFEVGDDPGGGAAGTVADGLVRRAGGPLNEPNRFAQVLIVLLPLALFQVRFGRSGVGRAFGLLSGFLILAGLLLTYSRGAILTLTVLVACIAAVGFVRPSRIVAVAVALLLAAPVLAPGIYDRVGSIGSALDVLSADARVGAASVARGRTTETLAAFQVFLDHPLLGVGPGQYLANYSVRYQLDPDIGLRHLPEPRRAHNLYAEMAAETGIVGLLVFLAIPLVLILMLWDFRRAFLDERPDLAYLATALVLSIVGYLGTGLFLHLAFERYYWLLVALATATCQTLGTLRPAPAPWPGTGPGA